MSKSGNTHRIAVGFALAALATCFMGTNAFAQAASNPTFFVAPAKVSDADISAFIAEPASLLNQYPTGGLAMQTRVRALAGSSADTLDPILGLVAQANAQQKAAIGAGLARAAKALATINPEYAALIQEKIAGINSPEVITAFLSASEEVQTAALGNGAGAGAPGGGAAAGIGGGGNAGPPSGGQGGDSSVPTVNGAFTGRGSGSTANTSGGTPATTTITNNYYTIGGGGNPNPPPVSAN